MRTNKISTLNRNVKAIGLALVITLFGGTGIQSCTYDFGIDSISRKQTARLKLNIEDFADFLDYYFDYAAHLRIHAVYGGSFEPLVDLSLPSLRGRTIDSKTAISALLNKDRVFQIDDRVVFVNEDFSVIKAIDAATYDLFLKSRPRNILNIPADIVVVQIILEDNVDVFMTSRIQHHHDCIVCGIRLIAHMCKAPLFPKTTYERACAVPPI